MAPPAGARASAGALAGADAGEPAGSSDGGGGDAAAAPAEGGDEGDGAEEPPAEGGGGEQFYPERRRKSGSLRFYPDPRGSGSDSHGSSRRGSLVPNPMGAGKQANRGNKQKPIGAANSRGAAAAFISGKKPPIPGRQLIPKKNFIPTVQSKQKKAAGSGPLAPNGTVAARGAPPPPNFAAGGSAPSNSNIAANCIHRPRAGPPQSSSSSTKAFGWSQHQPTSNNLNAPTFFHPESDLDDTSSDVPNTVFNTAPPFARIASPDARRRAKFDRMAFSMAQLDDDGGLVQEEGGLSTRQKERILNAPPGAFSTDGGGAGSRGNMEGGGAVVKIGRRRSPAKLPPTKGPGCVKQGLQLGDF